jgi:translation initiation factor IF-2
MTNKETLQRPPVIVVMGHIDHGKSTLLDYIRSTKITESEAGGITQHLSAYEVLHKTKEGVEKPITFLDTPGHEAFQSIRTRGASVADIAILVVSADDGVKPQTLEALKVIQKDKLPFVVAINKIDKPDANVDKIKQNLAENDIFLEGYGGSVPWVAVSAKTGEGVSDLLDLLLLVADLEDLTGDSTSKCEGVIIESNLDPKKGIAVTAIIQNGTLTKGEYAVAGVSISPLRIVEDFLGKPIQAAHIGSPVQIIGWDTLPAVGSTFICVPNKKDAVKLVEENKQIKTTQKEERIEDGERRIIPIIIKADTAGSLDALVYEIGKIGNERIAPKIIISGIGQITENDIRTAGTDPETLVIGFHSKTDSKAENLALRLKIEVHTFEIIYKLTEWLTEKMENLTPTIEVEEITGVAKILKTFSRTKDKQVIGGRLESGSLSVGEIVHVIRRESEITRGKIKELQQSKQKISSVSEGEFGALIEAKFDIAPGDFIQGVKIVKK